MSVQQYLKRIRTAWLNRVTNSMARGAGLRENFHDQLERFYDLIIQAADTGDPAWMDSIIRDWASSTTQSDQREGQKNISAILNQMVTLTHEIARDNLSDQEANDLIGALLPVFTHALDKAARHEMETRVAFIEKELNDFQSKLERLDRSKSNFIAVAAHELKTPLTLIEGYTSMMHDVVKNAKDNGQIDALLSGVYNGIHRLHAIIDDMIDVSLIDNNLLSLNFQPTWLNQIFKQLKASLIGTISIRKQSIQVKDFPGAGDMLFADPERLHQAFRNILTNAVKYTPDGGRISVDGRTLPGFVEVTITDNGIGISSEDQITIFEKFGQLGKAAHHSSDKTKFKGGGAGLGLPIAKGIVEAHGGAVWVESDGYDEEKCPGSTFHVLLPLRKEPPDPKLAMLFGLEIKQEN